MQSNGKDVLTQQDKIENNDAWFREQAQSNFSKLDVNQPCDKISKQLSLTLIFLDNIKQKTPEDIKFVVDCSFQLINVYRQMNHYQGVLAAYFTLHQYIMKLDLNQFPCYVKEERDINMYIYKPIRFFGFEPFDILLSISFFDIAASQLFINSFNHHEIDLRSFVLRAFTVQHIMLNLKEYRAHIKGDPTYYLSELATTGGWVDNVAISAFSREYNVSIVIIDTKTSDLIIIKRVNPAKTIFVGYETGFRFINLQQKIINPIVTEKLNQTPVDSFPPTPSIKKLNTKGAIVSHSMFYRIPPVTEKSHPNLIQLEK